MNKKISLGAAVTMLLIVAAFVFSITYSYAQSTFNQRVTDLRNREMILEKYFEIDQLVRVNYYGEINESQLMNSVAQGYLEGIGDKYSRYISAEEYKKMLQEAEGGDTVGIGAEIDIAPDDFYLVINEVYPDSPAEVAGLQAGDLIIKVDDTEISRENSAEMLAAISGPQGSNISIVTRRGSEESGPHVMTRRAVSPPTVLYTRMLENSTVGYMYISEFRDRTYDQFNRELLGLVDQGATALVIDLRDNASDTLGYATRILDKLLPEGTLVSASYKDGTVEELAASDVNAMDLPLVVLTNAGTTGVSELFAQCVRDFEQGQIVGTTTAGKGMMQDILKLSDGSAIELATALYLSPSGQSVQNTGIKADYEVAMEMDWKTLVESEDADLQLVKAKEIALNVGGVALQPTEEDATSEDESSEEDEDSSADEDESSDEDEDSSADEDESSEEDEDSSADEDESSDEDEDSSADEDESSEEDEDSSADEGESSEEDENSSVDEDESSEEDEDSSVDEDESSEEDEDSSVDEDQE